MVRMAMSGGYSGTLYPVNPKYGSVEGLRCYPGLADLPVTVDHVVLGVANHRLEAALHEAIRHGAKAATVFASAYLDKDREPRLGERMAAMAREAGVALCGPNCMGFSNPQIGLHVAAYPGVFDLQPGTIAWIAQSGSVFGAIAYNDRRLRFNVCVSSGAERVTTSGDYLDWALHQPSTRVVGMFLESVRDPAGFEAALADARERAVPVVVLKAGRTPQSAAMARTHTGAIAGNDAAYQALFDHYGVTRVYTLDELAATLLLFAQPRRAGPGALVSIHDSGGECELLTDLADDLDVPIAALEAPTRARLRTELEPGLEPVNPLDAWGTGRDAPGIFKRCFIALLEDPNAAMGLVVSDMRVGHYHHRNLADMAMEVARAHDKPLAFVTNYSLVNHREPALALTVAGIPVLDGTYEALRAVKHFFAYRDFLARAPGPAAEGPTERCAHWVATLEVRDTVDEALAMSLLADYGVETPRFDLAHSRAEALEKAAAIGYPVALKTAEPGISHKSDVGGVRLALHDRDELAAAYDDLAARLGPRVLVAAMAPKGVEFALGAVNDAQFGPLVMVATGGSLIELLEDRVVSRAPVDRAQAERMVARLRFAPLLEGIRGGEAADTAGFITAIVRFSRLAHDLADAYEQIDVNPVIVGPGGAMAVDALVLTKRLGTTP